MDFMLTAVAIVSLVPGYLQGVKGLADVSVALAQTDAEVRCAKQAGMDVVIDLRRQSRYDVLRRLKGCLYIPGAPDPQGESLVREHRGLVLHL